MKLKIITLLILAVSVLSGSAQSEEVSEVIISAIRRTYVLSAPQASAQLVRTFEAGVEEGAFGRDGSGKWLRILNGWVLAEVFSRVGENGALPDATHSVNITVSSAAQLYDGPSAKWFSVLGEMTVGSKAVALGRNESGSWLRLPQGWIEVAHVETNGDIRPLPVAPSGVIITARTRTFILKEPDISAEFVGIFEAGEEALAIGQAGDWIQISLGWVSAEAVNTNRDPSDLPYSGGIGIQIEFRGFRTYVRERPGNEGKNLRRVQNGEIEEAFGRTEDGRYLFVGDGWVPSSVVSVAGDIMLLPVMDETAATSNSTSSVRATATTRETSRTATNWTSNKVLSLIVRHTKNISILKLDFTNSATTIEYDLKPWPFVPNEQIANEVAFKIICAIRKQQQIPKTLKLIGQGHFKNDIGRKFKSPSVEIHINARNANRIVCSGNDYSDINWRSIASRYKSYPIPSGSKVDYD